MATIALYAGKVNQMPALIKNVKKSVTDYKTELSKLKKKTLSVDRSVCNMDAIISQVQSSTQTQEDKIQFLDKVSKDSEEFITDTAKIDSNVADIVNKRKDEFYEKYYYLKPECEKSRWEKIKDDCKKVGEWCKEHWRIIVAAVVVVVAVVVACLCPVLAPILIAAGKAALWGAAIGGLMGGLSSVRAGGSFWKGFEEGAFTGALMGALGTFAGVALGLAGSATGTFLINLSSNSCRILGVLNATFKISSSITVVMGAFDTVSLISEIFFPGNPLSTLNGKLHSNVLYEGFQQAAGFAAIFSGAAYHQMNKYPHTCFVAGTMILTAMGLVAIENIKAGDRVIATSMLDFTTCEKRVVETYIRKTENLIHLTIHNEEITTTPDHPFYVKDQGFTDAADLKVGDQIINAVGSSYPVEAIHLEIVEDPETVYNFQVEDFHTYYVGDSCILVHNNNYKGANPSNKKITPPDQVNGGTFDVEVPGAKFIGDDPVSGSHNATVKLVDSDGNITNVWREVSGNATDSEKALGTGRMRQATHTEQRALTRANLTDETMIITGQKRPCPNCQGAMRKATLNNSAKIIYQWRENGKTFKAIWQGGKKLKF